MKLQKQTLAIAVVCCLLFSSCAQSFYGAPKPVSVHPGVTVVAKPPLAEKDEKKWFTYYQDQFDAYEGMVAMPSDEYPEIAKTAYYKAKKEREAKMNQSLNEATTQNSMKALWLIPAMVGGILLIVFVL